MGEYVSSEWKARVRWCAFSLAVQDPAPKRPTATDGGYKRAATPTRCALKIQRTARGRKQRRKDVAEELGTTMLLTAWDCARGPTNRAGQDKGKGKGLE